jgi:hypothetical protein
MTRKAVKLERMSDAWPPRIRETLDANSDAYAELVPRGGTPSRAGNVLANLSTDQLFDRPVTSRVDADGALAGLWLWLDGLDESHQIVQPAQSGTLAFWHAIMHRREGDFWNSKYWYARCRNHPAIAELGPAARELLGADSPVLQHVLDGDHWDADGFVDLVERVHAKPAGDALRQAAVKLQRLEWERLFASCVTRATQK